MIVIDANVLISALLKNSITRRIIVELKLDFCFPKSSLEKIEKYRALVCKKAGLSESAFDALLHKLLGFITLVPFEDIVFRFEEAEKIMNDIDPEDSVFVAAALSKNASI